MKQKSPITRAAAMLLVLVMLLSAAACSGGAKPAEGDSSSSSSAPSSTAAVPAFVNPLPILDVSAILAPEAPDADTLKKINDAYNQNSDVVGWLRVPNTDIDNEVLHYPGDAADPANPYYLRRDITKGYNWYGCYFADYECKFGDRNQVSNNVIIYGHSMDDNPESVKFSQLKKYKDIEFLKQNPYIYLTTPEDQMVYKVFSVMYTDIDFKYNLVDKKGDDFMYIVNEMKDRSKFDIDTDVKATDKILTLSTCTYVYGSREDQRYVVAARLLRPGEQIEPTLKAEENADVKAPQFK